MLAKKTMTAAIAALAAVGLMSLTGCGGGAQSAAPATSEPAAPATTSAAAPATTSAPATSSAPAVDYKLVTPGTLTACADIPYPPFEVEDPNSPTGYSGFDLDIMGAIAEKLGLKFKVIDVDFNALQSGAVLVTRQCDIGTSAITIKEERKANIDFADPYYDSLQSLLVKASSGITDLKGLSGKTIGVQAGTTGKDYAEANAPKDAKIVEFPSDGEMWPAIKAGRVDALLQDQPVNHMHEQADPAYKIVAEYQTNEQYGFALAKGKRPELLAAVNAALKTMRSDGTYDTIYKKYFG